MNESKTYEYETEIGTIFHLKGYFSSLKEPRGDYEGHFTITLYMGGDNDGKGLPWDIKIDWVRNEFKKELSGITNQIVFANFSHNDLTFQYIKKEDCQKIWDISVKILTDKLLTKTNNS